MNQDFARTWLRARGGGTRHASALLIVLLLLTVMTTLMVSNSVILRRLKVELQLLEQKQQRAWQPSGESLPKHAGTNTTRPAE